MAGDFSQVGIGWTVGVPSGWGTYGVNLAVELARKGIEPALFLASRDLRIPTAQMELLQPALLKQPDWQARAKGGGFKLDFPMLLSLGDGLDFYDVLSGARGAPTVGVPFFESAVIPEENVSKARMFDLIVAGSTWNAEVMTRHGVAPVRKCFQGVDLDLFKPGPKTGRFAGRFAVFSGGKLEYRKGQDLGVAAFKRFYQRHNDALLVAAWHNPWPKTAAQGLSISPHVNGPPGLTREGQLDVIAWLRANGLPETAFHDLGSIANFETASLLREMDLAIFPNRCEGGTNLVAMECMACGIPAALSRNTGHLDLIAADNCYSLDMQIPMGAITNRREWEGWGESSIDELVTKMERAYTDRADAARRGMAGAAFMKDWGWPAQVDRLLAVLREFS
jgi:glycosyltransferase involved in cell wall biosynthesis